MILTVSGWRYWTDPQFVITRLEGYDDMFGLCSIHLRVGCCRTGVDKFVRDWAAANLGRLASRTIYRADWDKLGKPAGPIRNGYMLRGEYHPLDPNPGQVTDRLLAFPQPGVPWRSPGSGTVGCIYDAISLAVDLDVPGYKGTM